MCFGRPPSVLLRPARARRYYRKLSELGLAPASTSSGNDHPDAAAGPQRSAERAAAAPPAAAARGRSRASGPHHTTPGVEAIITPRYAGVMGSMRFDIAPQATRTAAPKLRVRPCPAGYGGRWAVGGTPGPSCLPGRPASCQGRAPRRTNRSSHHGKSIPQQRADDRFSQPRIGLAHDRAGDVEVGGASAEVPVLAIASAELPGGLR